MNKIPEYISVNKSNELSYDWYGGPTELNINDLHLKVHRGYGLGANMFHLFHQIVELKAFNLIPTKITSLLTQFKNYDLYNNIFYKNDDKVQQWLEADPSIAMDFRNKVPKTYYGFGHNKDEIISRLNYFSLVLNTFFNFKDYVIDRANQIILQHNIDLNNTTFVWWRKGNKTCEVLDYPEFNFVQKYILNNHTHILQTEDTNVLEEFKTLPNLKNLDVLPVFVPSTTVDIEMNSLSEEQYKEKYGKEYFDSIPDTFALVIVASRCKRFLGFPGHLSQLVCILRREFDNNAYIFKNKTELF